MKFAFIFIVLFIIFLFIEVVIIYKFIKKTATMMKEKKAWEVLLWVVLVPMVLYMVFTLVLIGIRRDCFAGYFTPDFQKVYWEGVCYQIVQDDEAIDTIEEYAAAGWENTDLLITDRFLRVAYFNYWFPDVFHYKLFLPAGKEPIYIQISSLTTDYYYVREE